MNVDKSWYWKMFEISRALHVLSTSVTKIRSTGDIMVIDYNENGVSIGEGIGISYNLSLDLVYIIISQLLHIHLGSSCQLSWKKKHTIWLRYGYIISHFEIMHIFHTYCILWVILYCGYRSTMVANHAYITYRLVWH